MQTVLVTVTCFGVFVLYESFVRVPALKKYFKKFELYFLDVDVFLFFFPYDYFKNIFLYHFIAT